MGDEEVHGEVLTVHEGVYCVPDGRGHHVGVDVAVVLVVEGGASQNHAKMDGLINISTSTMPSMQ